MAYTFNEDVFVIDCWTDTEEKENIFQMQSFNNRMRKKIRKKGKREKEGDIFVLV